MLHMSPLGSSSVPTPVATGTSSAMMCSTILARSLRISISTIRDMSRAFSRRTASTPTNGTALTTSADPLILYQTPSYVWSVRTVNCGTDRTDPSCMSKCPVTMLEMSPSPTWLQHSNWK